MKTEFRNCASTTISVPGRTGQGRRRHQADNHFSGEGKVYCLLVLAYKIAKHFGLTIEEVFDFSEVEDV